MTSKERVLTALSGGVPDRIPVLPQICPPHAISNSGQPLNETIVDRLRHSEKYDRIVAECAAAYGVDGFRVWLGGEDISLDWNGEDHYARNPLTGEPFSLIDFSGGGGLLRLPENHRELNRIDIDSIILPDESKLSESRELEPLKKSVARYGQDMFIIGVPGQFTIETLAHYQGMERTLIDIIERPDFVKQITEKQLSRSISYAKAMLDAGAHGLYIGETFGQFMSPEQFKELCLPYFQRFVDEVKPYGGIIYLHMCGRINHLLDLIPETGVDALEPLDVVGGTDIQLVVEKLQGKVALMGGVSTLALSRGTIEEVQSESKRCISEAGEKGAYVLAACDMLPTETESGKIDAMVQTAAEYGTY